VVTEINQMGHSSGPPLPITPASSANVFLKPPPRAPPEPCALGIHPHVVTRKDLITYVDAAPAVYPGVKEDLKVKAEKTELNS
jgi:hypothetical protein